MKFVDSYYDKENGVSVVVVEHLGLDFIGKAKLNPEDKEIESSFAGCRIAEMRATINALKFERKLAKRKADEAIDFIKACENYKNFNKLSPTARVMYRQANRRIKKVNDLTDEINLLLEGIEQNILARDIAMKKIKEKVLDKKNESKEDN